MSQAWVTDFTFTFHFHALEKEMATHSSVLAWRIPRDGEALWAAVYGVAQSRTRLKHLSSSSSSNLFGGFPSGSVLKHLPATQKMWVWSLGQEDPLEEGMATHFRRILAWRIQRTEVPGRLQSIETKSRTWLKQLSVHTCSLFGHLR